MTTSPSPIPVYADPVSGELTLTAVPVIHPAIRVKMRNPADRQAVHKAVMSLFPHNLPGPEKTRRHTSNILFRLDQPAQTTARLLIQAASPLRTDLPGPPLTSRSLRPFLDALNTGTHVQFRAVLNAVKVAGKREGRAVTPVTGTDNLAAYGLDRLTRAGFASVTLTTVPTVTLLHAHGTLATAQYDGRALIADPDHVKAAIADGIGRGKSYGCGLLSLAIV